MRSRTTSRRSSRRPDRGRRGGSGRSGTGQGNRLSAVGNRTLASTVAGSPVMRDVSAWDPAKFSSYGEWLAALPSGAVDETSLDITAEVAKELPVLAGLIEDLKADCADVGIILRHFWLKGNGQTGVIHGRDPKEPKKRKKWKIGAGVSKKQLRLVLIYIGTVHFQKGERDRTRQLDWYGGSSPHLNLHDILLAGLEPGDVLMWKKNPGIEGNFSGHFQTVQRINRDLLPKGVQGPRIQNSLDVLQGTMYEGERAGELQSKRLTYELLTGDPTGNADITYQPGNEEHFVGAGKWR